MTSVDKCDQKPACIYDMMERLGMEAEAVYCRGIA
jgi:hypothetical protein